MAAQPCSRSVGFGTNASSFFPCFAVVQRLRAHVAAPCASSRSSPVFAVLGDFEHMRNGPAEPVRPRFHRDTFESTGVVVSEPVSGSPQQAKRKRRGRKFKAATPEEALLGAAISALCTGLLWHGVETAAGYLSEHPPSQGLPNNLSLAVNSGILSFVWGTGGLAVSMFGLATVGLTMLAIQNTGRKSKQP